MKHKNNRARKQYDIKRYDWGGYTTYVQLDNQQELAIERPYESPMRYAREESIRDSDNGAAANTRNIAAQARPIGLLLYSIVLAQGLVIGAISVLGVVGLAEILI